MAKREFGSMSKDVYAEAAPATVDGELPFEEVTEEDASGRQNGSGDP